MSRIMLAATAFAMAVLMALAFIVPTCRRAVAATPVVIVDTVASPTRGPGIKKQRTDSASHKGKKRPARKQKEVRPPSSRSYLDETI